MKKYYLIVFAVYIFPTYSMLTRISFIPKQTLSLTPSSRSLHFWEFERIVTVDLAGIAPLYENITKELKHANALKKSELILKDVELELKIIELNCRLQNANSPMFFSVKETEKIKQIQEKLSRKMPFDY